MTINRTQIICLGLVFHILAAIFSIGYHHCDELFQIYEFAGYKLGINNAPDLPWEFHHQMRSGIQPLIVFCFTNTLAAVSVHNPFAIAMVIRFFTALFSFIAIFLFTIQIEKNISIEKVRRYLWFLTLLLWCIPYFHARFSSENLSASIFLLGLVLSLRNQNSVNYLLAGLLFGLAFLIRFQVVFMIAGLICWLLIINRTNFKYILLCGAGIFAGLALGLFADNWLYGNYTLSWWNYVDQNLFHDKASAFGKQPFYFFITEALLHLIPPFSLFIVAGVIYFWWCFRKHVVTWITLPFILIHFLVGHKELRFLFPVLNFLPCMLIFAFQSQGPSSRMAQILTGKPLTWSFLAVNFVALLIFTFKPADEISFSLKKIYETLPDKRTVLLYENDDPYGNAAALNFFRKKNVTTHDLTKDSLINSDVDLLYFSRSFSSPETISKGKLQFKKVYASYPSWFSSLNFNDWQSRSFSFSIYKHHSQ